MYELINIIIYFHVIQAFTIIRYKHCIENVNFSIKYISIRI